MLDPASVKQTFDEWKKKTVTEKWRSKTDGVIVSEGKI
jgi:hypothetical protein